MRFQIRAAVPEDAAKCADIHMRSWEFAYRDCVPMDIIESRNAGRPAKWRKMLETSKDIHYVAVYDNVIVGCVTINPTGDSDLPETAYELSSLYLDPDYVGKGFGRLMMDWAKGEIASRGYRAIALWVLDKNYRAKAFYEKCGFKPDGKCKESGLGDTLEERYICVL